MKKKKKNWAKKNLGKKKKIGLKKNLSNKNFGKKKICPKKRPKKESLAQKGHKLVPKCNFLF